MRIFWKLLILALPGRSSGFHFSVGFYIKIGFESDGLKAFSNEWDWREKTMFILTNQPLITSFYIKKYQFFAELAMS